VRLIALLIAVLATPLSAEQMTLAQCKTGFASFAVTFPVFGRFANREQRLSDQGWCAFDAGGDLWPVPARWRFWDEAGLRTMIIEASLGPILAGCPLNFRGQFVQNEAEASLEISSLEMGWSRVDQISAKGRVTGFSRTAYGKRYGPLAAAEISELTLTASSKHGFLRSLLERTAIRNKEDNVEAFTSLLYDSLSGKPVHPSLSNAQNVVLSALEDMQHRNGRLHLEMHSDAGLNAGVFLGWLLFHEPLEPDQAQTLFATTITQGRWEPAPEMAGVVTSPCGAPLSRSAE